MNQLASVNFLKAHNARHVWHPMGDPKVSEADPPLIVSRGDGVYVHDVDGKRYLDCVGGVVECQRRSRPPGNQAGLRRTA